MDAQVREYYLRKEMAKGKEMTVTAKLTSKGQITIPKAIREAIGIREGDEVVFTPQADGSIRMTARTFTVDQSFGMLRRPGQRPLTLEEMDDAIAEGAMARAGLTPRRRTASRR